MASLSSDTLGARPASSGTMLYVSLLVELLRSRPELLFWMATLAQAFLWVLVSTLTYSAPPGHVPLVLAAFCLLHYWRAVGEDRPRYWLLLGLDLGLLLLTTYAGLILLGLLVLFTLSTAQGRASLASLEPWLGGMIAVLIVFPHLMWIDRTGGASAEPLPDASSLLIAAGRLAGWLQSVGWLVAFHAGALVLVVVAGGLKVDPRTAAPGFERAPVPPFAKP